MNIGIAPSVQRIRFDRLDISLRRAWSVQKSSVCPEFFESVQRGVWVVALDRLRVIEALPYSSRVGSEYAPGMTPPDHPAPATPRHRGRVVLMFLAALIAADFAVLATDSTWKRYSPDDYRLRVDECARHRRDIVFAGGSPIAEGVDPELLGAIPWHGEAIGDFYNLGLSGGTTSDFYFAVRRACPAPPKVLVYGITASDLNDGRHEPHGVQSLMTRDDVRDWRTTRPDAAEWVTRHYLKGELGKVSSLYRHRFGIRMWAANTCEEFAPGSCPESATEARRQLAIDAALHRGTGYAPTQWFAGRRYSDMKASGWVAPPFAYLANYRTGSHLKYLHRLLDWAGEQGVEIILIDMPVTADLEARHPAEFAEYRRHLAEVSKSRGVTVLRGAAAKLDDDHFADLIHLNRTGTVQFCAWLRGELLRLGEPQQPWWTPQSAKAWAEKPR